MTRKKSKQYKLKEKEKEKKNAELQCQLLRISHLLLMVTDFCNLLELTKFDIACTNKIMRNQYNELIKRYCPAALQFHNFNQASLKYCMNKFYCKDLTSCHFKFGVEDEQLQSLLTLSPLMKVESLCFTYCDLLSDRFISNMIESCPTVKSIDLSGALNASMRTVSVLCRVENLEELHLSQVKHISIYNISGILNSATNLKLLNLSWVFGITDGILLLIGKLTKLEVLMLISQHDCSEQSVRDLCVSLSSLREIHLDYCRQITPILIEELKLRGIKATL
jgi:hypothetical protein